MWWLLWHAFWRSCGHWPRPSAQQARQVCCRPGAMIFRVCLGRALATTHIEILGSWFLFQQDKYLFVSKRLLGNPPGAQRSGAPGECCRTPGEAGRGLTAGAPEVRGGGRLQRPGGTMDSTTGTISHMSGRSKPTEAFSFECEVTAHQAAGVMLASSVTVAADLLSYSSATLLFHAHGSEAPLTTGTGSLGTK